MQSLNHDGCQLVKEENKVIKVGNYMPSNHNASRIIDVVGVDPTVMENHGTITAIMVNDDEK